IGKVALLTGTLIGSLVLAEGMFRIVSREKVDLAGLYTSDAGIVVLKAGFHGSMQTSEYQYDVAINNLTIRDGAIPEIKMQELRVLLIGDSFVLGVGVNLEDSLAKLLEHRLRLGTHGYPIEVLNAGVPGYSPYQELLTLRRLAPIVSPDLVIQVLFMGDDWF